MAICPASPRIESVVLNYAIISIAKNVYVLEFAARSPLILFPGICLLTLPPE